MSWAWWRQVAAINAEKQNIRSHAAVANGQCLHVEMKYTASFYFIFISISIISR